MDLKKVNRKNTKVTAIAASSIATAGKMVGDNLHERNP